MGVKRGSKIGYKKNENTLKMRDVVGAKLACLCAVTKCNAAETRQEEGAGILFVRSIQY